MLIELWTQSDKSSNVKLFINLQSDEIVSYCILYCVWDNKYKKLNVRICK